MDSSPFVNSVEPIIILALTKPIETRQKLETTMFSTSAMKL
jgi:hypothetical protein